MTPFLPVKKPFPSRKPGAGKGFSAQAERDRLTPKEKDQTDFVVR